MIEKDAFVERYGGIFEHSPFVAEHGYERLASDQALTVSTIHLALCQAFRAADRDERLGVLRAHPDLAGKLAISGGLTEASKSEQAGAGLDRLSPTEHARFPFIIAVKGLGKDDILRAFEKRIKNTKPDEFATACNEVEKIALLRLRSMHPES
jgi:2-oxo-4-hydroxy-4-carboxy-5-ureidoimidazoline decarboxylase